MTHDSEPGERQAGRGPDPDTDQTAPLSYGRAGPPPYGPPPSYGPPPPYGRPRPEGATLPYPDYLTRPMPPFSAPAEVVQRPAPSGAPRHRERSRLAAWAWPAIACLALIVGVLGGVAGGALHARLTDGGDGPVREGLSGVDTVEVPPLSEADSTVVGVAAELLPSSVQILAEFGGEEAGATGSGFVLDRQGHIVTNNHVVAEAASDDGKIEIIDHEGDRYTATVVGRSPTYDLAVLQSNKATVLKPASLGSAEALRVGEQVVAIGSPLGLSSTVTAGIVSAKHRPVTTGGEDAGDNSYINAVQTDAAINPGNSGGPLVNMLGQVVGVNTAIATPGGFGLDTGGNIGVGFAIPIEQVKITADQILRNGEARYPVIGARVQTGDREPGGAVIDEVMPGTPADESGLKKGDIVVEVDGERVTDGIALIVAIRSHQPGETLTFTVLRDGRERSVEVKLESEVG